MYVFLNLQDLLTTEDTAVTSHKEKVALSTIYTPQ